MKRSILMTIVAIAALACLALAGASSALATGPVVLCKKSEETCKSENILPAGSTITAEASGSSNAFEIKSPNNVVSCSHSTIKATVGTNSSESQSLTVTSWTLGTESEHCISKITGSCSTAEATNLPYSANSIASEQSIRVTEPHLHFQCGTTPKLDCTYYFPKLPLNLGGDHKSLAVNELHLESSGTLCEEIEKLTVSFKILNPESALYVERGHSFPKVTTEAVNHITAKGGTLTGQVNPEGSGTTYWFEYGTSTSYGSKTTTKEAGSGTSAVAVSQLISGLINKTPYYYRLVAKNEGGESWGEPMTFVPGGAPTYRSTFGAANLTEPVGISLSSSGNLWLADLASDRAQLWEPGGKFIGSVGEGGSRPTSVVADSSGNVYLAEDGRIAKFSAKGSFLSEITGFSALESISLDSQGNIWTADAGEYVEEYSPAGKGLQLIWVGSGGELTGVAVSPTNGDVYVADYGKQTVEEYDESSGALVREWGPLLSDGSFMQPVSLAVDSEGNVWVTDEGNDRVREFTETGEAITKFGAYGSGTGQFILGRPGGIAVTSKGEVWLTDQGNHRVQMWSR